MSKAINKKKKAPVKKIKAVSKKKPIGKRPLTKTTSNLVAVPYVSVSKRLRNYARKPLAQGARIKDKLFKFGIGVDDVKASVSHKVTQLDSVLREIKSREFLKNPAIQKLMGRAAKQKDKTPKKSKMPKPELQTLRQKKKRVCNDLAFLSKVQADSQELGTKIVQSVLSRVEEIRDATKKATDQVTDQMSAGLTFARDSLIKK